MYIEKRIIIIARKCCIKTEQDTTKLLFFPINCCKLRCHNCMYIEITTKTKGVRQYNNDQYHSGQIINSKC